MKKPWQAARGGMAAGMPKPDGNMMLEMQLKMARRAERAAAGSDGAAAGSNEGTQQQWLAKRISTAPQPGAADGVGAALASDAASGALWAKRRQSQQGLGGIKPQQLGEASQSLMSPSAMKAAQVAAT